MDLEKYRTLFVDEANDHLVEMSRAVATLEKRPSRDEAAEAVECLFRMAHSIKGMAASLEYAAPEALAHALEDWMEPFRNGSDVPDDGVTLLYETLSALESMIWVVSENGGAPRPRHDLLERLAGPAVPSSDPERLKKKLPSPPSRPRATARRRGSRAPRPPRCRRLCASAPRRWTGSWRGSVT